MAEQQIIFDFEQRPTIKGYPELRWTGKRPYRSTQYYPAQLKETYGKEQDGWINKIYWGDNLQVMSHLLKDYRGKIDLIYIDPPFDSKADYKRKIEVRGKKVESDSSSFEEKQYGDIWTNDEYLQFMYERLILLKELLSETGIIALHCDYHKSAYLKLIIDEVFGTQNFVNEIIWKYESGGIPESFYSRKHDSIFIYAKGCSYQFNKSEASFPRNVCQMCGQRVEKWNNLKKEVDSDGRIYRSIKSNGKIYKYYDDEPALLSDVWTDISHIQQKDPQRVDYPTQKPEALISRIIRTFSKKDDIVFDCFMGSGTTQAVAMKLGRRFIGADINLGAIQTTTKRLLAIADALKAADNSKANHQSQLIEDESKEEFLKYTGFEVYNVNNYDFFRNPEVARDLIIKALEIQSFQKDNIWDGELDGRMVKIMPANRIATKADLKGLIVSLPYKTYNKLKEENPDQPVERITIVCMGHEPDLKGALEQALHNYKIDVQIVDILRDKKELQLKRDSEAEVVREGNKLVIRSFYPMNLMQKLSLQKEYVDDWRMLVDSIMIDWNYDGAIVQPTVIDIPEKNKIVKGIYDIPEDAGSIKVKITDLLSESLEVEVR